MIGIDTHILLRLWLNDDPAQNKGGLGRRQVDACRLRAVRFQGSAHCI